MHFFMKKYGRLRLFSVSSKKFVIFLNMNISHNILKKFRELMALKNIGVYVLPRTDEHQVPHFSYRVNIYVNVIKELHFYLALQDLMLLQLSRRKKHSYGLMDGISFKLRSNC